MFVFRILLSIKWKLAEVIVQHKWINIHVLASVHVCTINCRDQIQWKKLFTVLFIKYLPYYYLWLIEVWVTLVSECNKHFTKKILHLWKFYGQRKLWGTLFIKSWFVLGMLLHIFTCTYSIVQEWVGYGLNLALSDLQLWCMQRFLTYMYMYAIFRILRFSFYFTTSLGFLTIDEWFMLDHERNISILEVLEIESISVTFSV